MVRLVHDTSSKEGKSFTFLNNCLHVDPSLTPLLVDIFLQFCQHEFPIIADIKNANLNVEFDP